MEPSLGVSIAPIRFLNKLITKIPENNAWKLRIFGYGVIFL